MAGEVSSGICVPVPGPMSRTIPEAVRRIGGIRAEEPIGSGISWLFGSEAIWRGAVVVVWLGFVYLFIFIYFDRDFDKAFFMGFVKIAKSKRFRFGLVDDRCEWL